MFGRCELFFYIQGNWTLLISFIFSFIMMNVTRYEHVGTYILDISNIVW